MTVESLHVVSLAGRLVARVIIINTLTGLALGHLDHSTRCHGLTVASFANTTRSIDARVPVSPEVITRVTIHSVVRHATGHAIYCLVADTFLGQHVVVV